MAFGRKRRSKGDEASLDLMVTVTAEQMRLGLDDWGWLGLDGKEPIFASAFGHVVLQGPDGVWWLDPNSGELALEWPDQATARAVMATERGQDEYLLGGLAIGAARRGIARGADQIYSFTPPPILGGGFDLDHVMTMDFVVGMSIMGQLMEQVRDLPPGTKISGFSFDDGT